MTKRYLRKLKQFTPNIHDTSIIDSASHDPEKTSYNFSIYNLTESD